MEKTRFSWNRLVALLLTCVMLIGLMPTALATGTGSEAANNATDTDGSTPVLAVVDGQEIADSGDYTFDNLDLTDTSVFANGTNDAYQVTIGGETKLVGDTTLKNWVGNWETWQNWIYPDEAMLARYPYLEEVWQIAYEAYIKAFEGTFMEEAIKAQYKSVDDLKAYWYEMTGTNGVENIKVEESENGGYLLSWLDADGKVLASDSYTMTGKVLNGLEGATMYVFTADTLEDDSEYKYMVTMVPDMEGDAEKPIARHYHFQFGSDLKGILANGQLANGYTYDSDTGKKVSDMVDKYWYATMTDADATDVAKYNVILGMHRAEKGSYTVTVKKDIQHGTVAVEPGVVSEGGTITVTATPDEGYTLTQVGYWTVDAAGKAGKLQEVTADETGAYTFAMPASNVVVGAAFQDSSNPVLVSKLNSNKIVDENNEDWALYIANGDAYLNVDDTETSVYLHIDKRFFELDGVTMTLEARQYSDSGYILAGEQTYSVDELRELISSATETTDSAYVFESIDIPLTAELREGYNVYCVVKLNIPSWIDAKGDAMYRWAYTGTDTIIFAKGAELPDAMVWLYNLDADSHRGALVREILEELGMAAGTVNSDNLGQRIGYMIQWPGYEAVEAPYSANEYDVEYMLMANLTEVQLDKLLDAMQDNNIRINLKSIPTAWTAGKTFEELFNIMAEEDEVLKAAIALDKMIYTAEDLDVETYSSSTYWDAFQEALAEAIVALSTDAEEDPEGANLYINAREKLLEAYLKVTNKLLLAGDLAITCETGEDGQYTLSAKLSDEKAIFSYSWTIGQTVASTTDILTVTAENVYKAKLTITGIDNYYGELTASLSVPSDPAVDMSAGKTSVNVTFGAIPETMNMPAPTGYVACLYQNGELVAEKEIAEAGTVTFDGLTKGTDYEVQTYAYNVVGCGNIQTNAVTTSSGGGGGSSSVPSTPDQPDTDEPGETGFIDVDDNDWFNADVAYVVEKGLMNGTTDTKFSPDDTTTRAMLMTILARLAGEDTTGGAAWYEKGMAWAVKNGVSDGTNPNSPITREQLATMLWRYAGSPAVEGSLGSFTDGAQASGYAVDALVWAVENGILTGQPGGILEPQGDATRAQVAAMLHRFCENVGK